MSLEARLLLKQICCTCSGLLLGPYRQTLAFVCKSTVEGGPECWRRTTRTRQHIAIPLGLQGSERQIRSTSNALAANSARQYG